MANERRKRQNFQHGTLSADLTAAAITINSAEFADMDSVDATEHAILVLDPKGINGDPEIVRVIAHTAATTVVTADRGKEGSTNRAHPQGTTWIWAPTFYDYVGLFTSSTRPTLDLYQGQLIYEINTDKFVARDAAGGWQEVVDLGAWDVYVPVNTNITVGNGTQTARFTRMGRLITVSYDLLWGSTTSFGGVIEVGLPVAARALYGAVGSVSMLESGLRLWVGTAISDIAVGTVRINHTESGGNGVVNATNPFTWSDNDRLSFVVTYEAVS